MLNASVNTAKEPLVHGQLSADLIQSIKGLIPAMDSEWFTGQYKRHLTNPEIIVVNKVAEYVPTKLALDTLFGDAEKLPRADFRAFRTEGGISPKDAISELVELPESIVEDIALAVNVRQEEVIGTTLMIKGNWLEEGLRLYHPKRPARCEEEMTYLLFKEDKPDTKAFFVHLWNYQHNLFKQKVNWTMFCTVIEKDGKVMLELKAPQYVLKVCHGFDIYGAN